MTCLVAIRCTDGVVVGADSSTTFTDGHSKIIEQTTSQKIKIVGDRIIIAAGGSAGLAQRFHAVVLRLWNDKALASNTSGIEFGKLLSAHGINDFKQTYLAKIDFTALVAFPAGKAPHLCEINGGIGFQPEMKELTDNWFVSAGSGQMLADPFLALLRDTLWSDGAPNLAGGIFTVCWALRHACKVNPGGINEPIRIAVLEREKEAFIARMLTDDELTEHMNVVDSATKHMASFREILRGTSGTNEVPKPATKPA
jgi:hypothetical protein